MRYHSDPDQGVLWDFQTAVVSLGASRRFSFREISFEGKKLERTPHTFVLMHGDVVEMFDDCQTRFQHTVRQAEEKNEEAARGSLVFKRSLRLI
jgi:alkylated DNA repair dioxygenase AlkB